MLVFILAWVWIVLISLPFGWSAVCLARLASNENGREEIMPVDYIIIIGLVSITVILSIISLFSSIGFNVNVVLLALSVVLFYVHRKKIKPLFNRLIRKPFSIVCCFIVGFSILLSATQIPSLHDVGLYHFQTIQWIKSYSVVSGLGNLQSRFAFNSHSFLLQSLFETSQFNFKNELGNKIISFPLNSFLLTLLITRVVILIKWNIIRKQFRQFIFYTSLFIVTTGSIFIIPNSNSPAADTFLFVFSAYSLLLFLNYFENKNSSFSFLIVFLLLFVCTVKISGIFLIILIPVVISFRKLRTISIFTFVSFFVLVPFFIRNYILSGYLVYPFPSIDFFNPDWKMPIEAIVNEKKWIESWARIPAEDCNKVLAMPISNWFPVWWNNLTLFWKVILLVNILSPFMLIVSFIQKRSKYSILYFTFILNIIFWFVFAPDQRFGLTSLLINFSLVVSEISFFKQSKYLYFLMNKGILYLLIIIFSVSYFNSEKDNLGHRLILPESLNHSKTKVFSEGTFSVLVPVDDDRCFDARLPCTPYPNKKLMMRGRSLQDGFRVSK